jgi:peroxiredoxin
MKTHLVKWDETYRKKGLVIVDINNGAIDKFDKLKAAVEKSGLKYPVAWDEDAKTCTAYGVKGYAASFLLGTDGKVVWEGFPVAKPIEEREALVKKELEKVTAEELKKIEEEMKGK